MFDAEGNPVHLMNPWVPYMGTHSPAPTEQITKKTNMASRPWETGRIRNGVVDNYVYSTGHRAALQFRTLILYDLDSEFSDLNQKEYDELFAYGTWLLVPSAIGTDNAQFLTERNIEINGGALTYYFRMVANDDVA